MDCYHMPYICNPITAILMGGVLALSVFLGGMAALELYERIRQYRWERLNKLHGGVMLKALLLFIALPAVAQVEAPAELQVTGLPQLLSEKVREFRPSGIITFAGRPGAAAHLPIWTWRTISGTPLVEFPTIGYRAIAGQRPDAFTHIGVNLPGLSEQWFGSPWFKSHVVKSKFPPVFVGPAVLVPLDIRVLEKVRPADDWQKYAALVVSARF